jgi:hypothetical protein
MCFPLYEQGCSLREIERQTGFAKSSIRTALSECGLTLRKANPVQPKRRKLASKMRSGVIPYGFAYLEGKLVMDPREYKVVLQMVKLWQSGKSFTAIAKQMNNQKIQTRLGKRWAVSVVGSIIRRHLETKK